MSLPTNTYTCPVTGLTILSKPEWHKVSFDRDYKVSVDIIGEQILLTHNFGTPSLRGVQEVMVYTSTIIEQFFQNRSYIHIINYTQIEKNIPLEARRHVIKELKNRNQMLAVIFYGLSPSLKLSVKIGRLFNQMPFTSLIARDYPEAMESALAILNDSTKNPLILEKMKTLNCETGKLIEELAQRETSPNESDPVPFDRAVELFEDEIKYLEENEDKIHQQETLERLDKIIRNRNEKAKTYWNSLRPTAKIQNQPKK